MIYGFSSAPTDTTLILWTDKPAFHLIASVDGIERVATIGPNRYSIVIDSKCDRNFFVRSLTSTLRNA